MTPGEVEDSFLTVAEVAATLKLNQQTVRNWIDQGSLPALRVGRRVRIRRSDFERLIAGGYVAGAAAARQEGRPSADDFWRGELVGVAEPVRSPERPSARPTPRARDGPPLDGPGQGARLDGPDQPPPVEGSDERSPLDRPDERPTSDQRFGHTPDLPSRPPETRPGSPGSSDRAPTAGSDLG